MKAGFVGLGKLGLPVALTLERAGHDVAGYELNATRRLQIERRRVPEQAHEAGLAELLEGSKLRLCGVSQLAEWADIILVCVQTPHEPRFEGVTPLEDQPQDFDYSWLRTAAGDVCEAVRTAGTDPLVVIVSTCLPGTFDREIRPLTDGVRFAYHPLFIAMGSVVEDYRNPEFVLVGSNDRLPHELIRLYRHVCAPIRHMSIRSAELTKVAYNAAIGYKLMLANGVAELADKVGADCDAVMGTLKLAKDRIVSKAYLTPGMGDGGGCHPRDQIALSWLAGEAGLSHDPFGFIIRAREAHAKWLAHEWEQASDGLPMILLGEAYKPNSTLKTGSHARLVAHYAREFGNDLLTTDLPMSSWPVACYFLATPHDHFMRALLPTGSVVVDPWGIYPENGRVTVVRPGRRDDFHKLPGSCHSSAAVSRVA